MTVRQPVEQIGAGEREPGADGVSVAWILAVLLVRRRLLIATTTAGLLLALVAALLKAPQYTSTFSFTPQSNPDQSRSGLAALAGQFGVAVGASSQPPQLYADLLSTRELLGPIARDSFPLSLTDRRKVPVPEFLKIKGADPRVVEERTIQKLRTRVVSASAAVRTTGVVGVAVRTESPVVSFEIAKRLVDGLNQFNVATRRSQAGEERRFTEGRLAEAKASLRAAEDALQYFLSANRQIGTSPQLTFQRERLQREVSLQQQVVLNLSQQYEEARIREVRDTPVITVIERPVLPAMPDPRGRAMMVILGTFAGLFVGVAFVLMREGWNRQRRHESADPSYSLLETEWQSVRRRFRKQ
jgi:uncharacterized protein involved in exopolysaccharide biosynthesis